MKKKFIILIISCVMYACSSNPNRIQLFNDVEFTILENENIVEIDSSIVSGYQSYFLDIPTIPLYRVVEGINYTVFIGVPYQLTLNKYIKSKQPNSCSFEESNDSYFYCQGKFKDTYFVEYLNVISENMFYVRIHSKSKDILNTVFLQNNLAKRFNYN